MRVLEVVFPAFARYRSDSTQVFDDCIRHTAIAVGRVATLRRHTHLGRCFQGTVAGQPLAWRCSCFSHADAWEQSSWTQRGSWRVGSDGYSIGSWMGLLFDVEHVRAKLFIGLKNMTCQVDELLKNQAATVSAKRTSHAAFTEPNNNAARQKSVDGIGVDLCAAKVFLNEAYGLADRLVQPHYDTPAAKVAARSGHERPLNHFVDVAYV